MANLESTQLKDGFQTLVSIGTTTAGGHPSNPASGSLTNGKGTALTQVTLGLGSVGAPSYSFTGDTDTGIFSAGANTLNLVTGNNTAISIAGGGNVSIGTSNSSAKLHVGTSSEEILRLERDTTTNDSFIDLTYSAGHSDDSDANHEYSKIRTKVVANLENSESSELHFQTINGGTMGTPMVIDNLGLVGIGSTSGGVPNPAYALEVQANSTSGVLAVQNAANDRNTFRSSNAAGTRTLDIGNNSSGHGILNIRNSSGTVNTQLLGSGDSYFNGGSVGIGTTSPSSMLNLNTTGTSNFGLKLSRNDSATDGFEFTYTPSNAEAFIENKYPASSGQVFGDIVFRHNVGGSQTERMRLEADGGNVIIQEKVGIGTTSPSSILHLESASSPKLIIKDTTNNCQYITYAQNSNAHLGTSSNHPLIIDTNNTERVRVLSSGGITFNGDTATANALDDYEEGTHTTSLSDGTYTAALGDNELAYTKIGNMVTITGQFFVASYNSSASASRVTLPFTIANLTDSAGNFAGTVRAKQLNTSNTHNVVAFGDEGNGYVLLQETVDNGTPVNIGGGAYSSGTEITLNFSYFTS